MKPLLKIIMERLIFWAALPSRANTKTIPDIPNRASLKRS